MEVPIIPKLVPLAIPQIGVGAKVISNDTITHAFEVFKTLDTILNGTIVIERLGPEPIPIVELVDTTSEKLIDDLAIGVEQVVISD